jgi:hypothetical protein
MSPPRSLVPCMWDGRDKISVFYLTYHSVVPEFSEKETMPNYRSIYFHSNIQVLGANFKPLAGCRLFFLPGSLQDATI